LISCEVAAPANYYAQFWHQNAINCKQYGFPDDDYAGQPSDISITNPQYTRPSTLNNSLPRPAVVAHMHVPM
jgi:hypothetical protein